MPYDPHTFIVVARGIGYQLSGEHRRQEKYDGAIAFKQIFGISPDTASLVYQLGQLNRKKVSVKHYLWAVALAKQYGTETVMASNLGTTRKTFRKRTYRALQACSEFVPHVVRTQES